MKRPSFSSPTNLAVLQSLIILFFSGMMFRIVLPYTSFSWDVDFLLTKPHLATVDYYRWAFYSHIFSSSIVLLSGVILLSSWCLRKFPKLHRKIGYLYVGLLLGLSAPSGLIMAFHANGTPLTQISFFIQSSLWWWMTWRGLQTARQHEFAAHRRWMLRSYALTFSAISLRVHQAWLGYFFFLEPEFQYLIVSWGSWVGNWGLVEVWLWWQDAGKRQKSGNWRPLTAAFQGQN